MQTITKKKKHQIKKQGRVGDDGAIYITFNKIECGGICF